MASVVIRIDLPPKGELETSGDGSSPTDDQMAEEQQIRQDFIDRISPQLTALLERPPRRSGNVTNIELLGTNVWSEMNHYLLTLSVDIGDPRIELGALVPYGGEATVIGSYGELQQWPEPATNKVGAPPDGSH